MRTAALIGCLVLAACSKQISATEQAEEEYRIFMSSGTPSGEDICRAQQRLAEAYLKELDEETYKTKRVIADITCQSVQLGSYKPFWVEQAENRERLNRQ